MTDYYQILNLKRTCSQEEIKSAYRELAHKYHPDKNKESNAHDKFIQIHEAYEILWDVEKRKFYDKI